MSRGFDRIAPFYDSLARLVFGGSIRRCQLEYLDKIPPGAKVLILGGGTGWLLTEVKRTNPTCTIWYLESSIKMLEIAKSQLEGSSNAGIFFIHGTEKNLQDYKDIVFDVVITSFYLDLFTTTSLGDVMKSIRQCVYPGSKLFVSDFVDRAWWHRSMLFIMYRFFRWTCGIEAGNLPDWQRKVRSAGFTEHDTTPFYGGFIKSSMHVFEGG
jgi:tRNA (cmo5U34)-methyltransferase